MNKANHNVTSPLIRAANEDPVIPEDEIWEEEIIDLPPQKFGKAIYPSYIVTEVKRDSK